MDYLNRQVTLSHQVETAEKISFAQGNSHLFLVNQREQDTANAQANVYAAKQAYFMAYNQLAAFCLFNNSCIDGVLS